MRRVIVFGCGGASGVPSVSMGWGACDPAEPRNRRLRPSILIEAWEPGRERPWRLLVDASPDLRQQLLAHDIRHLDGVVITHAHADHVHGLDELREINRAMKAGLDVWATPEVVDELVRRFGYCFSPPAPEATSIYKPLLRPRFVTPGEAFHVGPLAVLPFTQDHGWSTTLGLRLGDFAYSTDVITLDEVAFATLAGIKTWIVGCFALTPHPTHADLPTVLGWIERLGPERAFLTHMTPGLDYRTLQGLVPAHVTPAHDGLILTL
ncbi:MBL fold metallo-hydrolase [Pararhodospirillum photometricum]|uniref:Beta-lactamase-like n=1 Tax=Pararhodospirillum photometricum DSM 122 TaxID=1150469 RepID=H6SLQ2_PARPM|nr:MBL fold metallo-hydrolase [Pararhodospirillum photometricum]CCG08917.1 Beta-lactamase-like [Pararhodospirillum photometricum DSM 122]